MIYLTHTDSEERYELSQTEIDAWDGRYIYWCKTCQGYHFLEGCDWKDLNL